LAFCLLHFALLAACARTPPALIPGSPLSPVDRLRRDILQVTQRPGVARGAWAVAVLSLDDDERLVELNSQRLLVPASIAKLVSVATAAEAVGWDYRFETPLLATGPIADGVLAGDLVIGGAGDPSIGGRAGPASGDAAGGKPGAETAANVDDLAAWIAALQRLGIRRIDGRIIGDDDAIEDPRPQLAWTWDDLGYPTGALFGALNLAENRLTVTVTAGPTPGSAASLTVEPHASYRPLSNRVVTVDATGTQFVWPEQRPGEPYLTVAGSVRAGGAPARLEVSAGNPTFWFASVLRSRLQQAGIAVSGEAWDVDEVSPRPATTSATVLYTHRSRPLADLVQPLLKNSINLYAEAVMRLNAARETVVATNDAALEGFRRRLAAWGIPPDGHQLIDGSGLSRRNAVTAETILSVLRRMHDATSASPFVTGLPVAAVDGTLRTRMTGTAAAGNLRAKTGTMSNIRSLAGYVSTADGERLAFVIMVNNFEGSGPDAEQAIDAIGVRLATFSRQSTPVTPR
jgi:D-alanyl-D-alanine carboxypeptidase/D-alanyl-D-alanine-endopeptidase (penicillin-binding protein 4)